MLMDQARGNLALMGTGPMPPERAVNNARADGPLKRMVAVQPGVGLGNTLITVLVKPVRRALIVRAQ